MRTWTRSAIRRECGRCGHAINPNEPAMRITFTVSAAVLWRCEGCDGPAPAEIPPLPSAPDRPEMLARIQRLLAATSRDWKSAQAGEE